MYSYQYSKLTDVDVRLLTLLPGQPESGIKITIHHAPLRAPPERPRQQRTSDDLQKSLPSGWRAEETVEGRFAFWNEDLNITSWAHPDASIIPSLYSSPADDASFSPQYEALSYTWGSADNPQTVQVISQGDLSEFRTLQIPKNLASALKHLRYPDKARSLWVDAICINQDDIPEKNTQVPRMADIFRLADRVVVWLGAESDNSTLALSTLDYLAAQVEMTKASWIWPSPGSAHQDWFHSLTDMPYDDNTWQAIADMANRPYFSRLWVVQEIHLSNHKAVVQCGPHQITWQRFRRAILCLMWKRNLPHSISSSKLPLLGTFCYHFEVVNFPILLLSVTYQACSNPRDKVYGLLGLASSSLLAHIRPQYALPVASVYRGLFLGLTNHMKRLHFEFCSLRTSQPRQFSSWIPDLSGDLSELISRGVGFVSGMSRAEATYRAPDVLEVCGILVGTVKSNKGAYPDDTSKGLAALHSWKPDNLVAGIYPTGESVLDAFITTLIQDRLRDRFPAVATWSSLQEFKDKLTKLLASFENPSDGHSNNVDIGSYAHDLRFLPKQAFVTCERGYFGLGHRDTEPGDIICAFLGCKVLVILRPATGGSFQVVGSCYLHGFSSTEAFLGPLPASWVIQYKPDSCGVETPYFFKKDTGEEAQEDPRLGELPSEWEAVQADRTRDDPHFFMWFRNKVTGETMNSDPRMLPEALRDRGVDLQTFRLV
ncbi:heterokaryon incompatibility protein-domain-containing protein [Dactylonectria estremocensis]|uniref:Heterokaryon incompatibility protein-domain-containing protein n=1 Tax=Dactylonectria estremocensis TaxID=1079267 RepID=A0A9P9ERF3_9HYPO|nr:heterokaryon incompatibility protein-domain-containing protein [Dactylonectria estremocensis]